MRVLLSSVPGFGHLGPMLGTARALRRQGHEVLVATAPSFHPAVAAAGLAVAAAGMSDEALQEERRRRWPATERQPPAGWAVRMFTDIAAPAMLEDVEALLGDWKPDLVIHDEGEYAAPVAAAQAGIPWVTHGWGSPLRPVETLVELREAVAPLWRSRSLEPPAPSDLYGRAVLDPCPPSLAPRLPSDPRRWPVRFEVPDLGEHSATTAAWATQRTRPVAYVGLGTVPLYADVPELLETVVGVVADAGFDVVVTTNDKALSPRLSAVGAGRVRVRPFVALSELLPQCSLVACHGGAGTVLSALAHGLPLLLLPRGAPSQLRMADGCASRGVARIVPSDDVTGERIAAEVAVLVTDATATTAAAEVAAEMAASPSPDSVAADVMASLGGDRVGPRE